MQVLPNVAPELCSRPDGVGAVTILQCTDLHHFEDESDDFISPPPRNTVCKFTPDGYCSQRALDLLRVVCERIKPNLVVFTGDAIDGRRCADPVQAMSRVTEPLRDEGIFWTFTPGNWDTGEKWGRTELLQVYKLPFCASEAASTFCHVLPVGPVELCLFDSKGTAGEHTLDTGVCDNLVDESQVAGYTELQRKRLDVSNTTHQTSAAVAVACFHIPLPEYSSGSRIVGHHGQPPDLNCQGRPGAKHQDVRLPKATLFDALARGTVPPVVATFAGHHHYNDAVVEKDGVWLCYGRVSGYTPPSDYEGSLRGPIPFQRGIRVLQYTKLEGGGCSTLSTWIEGIDGEEAGTRIEKQHTCMQSSTVNGLCGRVSKLEPANAQAGR
eukprot:2941364-Pyramimonas_sp.AAC.1